MNKKVIVLKSLPPPEMSIWMQKVKAIRKWNLQIFIEFCNSTKTIKNVLSFPASSNVSVSAKTFQSLCAFVFKWILEFDWSRGFFQTNILCFSFQITFCIFDDFRLFCPNKVEAELFQKDLVITLIPGHLTHKTYGAISEKSLIRTDRPEFNWPCSMIGVQYTEQKNF